MSEDFKDGLKHHCENHDRCMEMIQAVLDGSATPEEMQHYKTEMKHCLPCIEGKELQEEIKRALNSKVEKKCCPESTISELKSKLSIASLTMLMLVCEIALVNLYF
ncbi:hypothetical protein [Jiulongibacter sp. NS-SX5]|uniref:hypothetical protein n=1 Tax=Jiulongibacter sp. NS-SX5 TaxID=3463854 RepID=UPI004057FE71